MSMHEHNITLKELFLLEERCMQSFVKSTYCRELSLLIMIHF